MYGEDIPVAALEDLDAVDEGQYRAINIGGLLADSVSEAYGILQNRPKNGEDAQVRFFGRSRFQAGGAVTSGQSLSVAASGWIIAAATPSSGGTTEVIGKAITGTASGGVARGIFNFTNRTLVKLV